MSAHVRGPLVDHLPAGQQLVQIKLDLRRADRGEPEMESDLARDKGADALARDVAAQEREHESRRGKAVRQNRDLLSACSAADLRDSGRPVVASDVVQRV